jgi:uncharacterized protein DUF397
VRLARHLGALQQRFPDTGGSRTPAASSETTAARPPSGLARRTRSPVLRQASYSGNGGADCLETGSIPGAVLIRDTKDRERGPVLRVSPEAWRAFMAGIKGQS